LSRGQRAAAFAFERGAAAVAFDVHLEDGGVVDEAIDDGNRHRLVGRDLAPFAKGLVGGDEERSPLVPGADEFKEHTGFGQVFGDVGEVIEDQEVVLVDLGDGGFESQFAAGDLKPSKVSRVLPGGSRRGSTYRLMRAVLPAVLFRLRVITPQAIGLDVVREPPASLYVGV
jgi:hypothetical protein